MANPRVLAGPSVTLTGAIATGSAVVTGLTVSSLEGALRVTGTGIPRGTLVKSIDSASQVTLTKNATATNASASLAFTLEPITLAQTKLHLRVEIDDDDELIATLIAAARKLVEGWFSRSFITSSLRYTLGGFDLGASTLYPYTIRIPWAEVLAVSSVSYLDDAGSTITVPGGNYQVFPGAPGRILPAYSLTWPSGRCWPDAVAIDFTAGYGPTAAYVSETTKVGLLLLIGHLYENREASSALTLKEVPFGIATLLAPEDWGYGRS